MAAEVAGTSEVPAGDVAAFARPEEGPKRLDSVRPALDTVEAVVAAVLSADGGRSMESEYRTWSQQCYFNS